MNCRASSDRARLGRTVAAILALLLAAVGCGHKNPGEATGAGRAKADTTAPTDTAQSGSTEREVRVSVAEVRRGDLVIPIYADGAIRTPRSVQVRTKIPGELIDVRVRDGDRVNAGQLLARLDRREWEIALSEARQRHMQALAQMAAEADEDSFVVDERALAAYRLSRERLDSALNSGRLARQAHQDSLLRLELAALAAGAFRGEMYAQRTGLTEARLAEERARLNLENTEIRAPFAGVVHGLAVVKGEILSTGATLCSLFDNQNLEAAVNVLEADLGNLSVGRPVLLAIPATGDTLRARVDVLSPRLDDASRTCEALVRFPNPQGRFRPGMFVRAEIAGWVYPDLMLVPQAALLVRDDRPLVFKVAQGRAQWLYVDIGRRNDRWVEITGVASGGSLSPGEQVVVSNHLTLAHEAKLEIGDVVAPHDRWITGGSAPRAASAESGS